ncbi:AraC family transcriptional regulator N-terminal domain-containing protein [Amycolatopsis sp. NPDC051903]|uniref:AraC family transcriptional regulator n=1 Tax=Amycolatopsis sp. NPDC051903 TaxID=3363936 RepID=UPI0037BCC9FE
MSSLAELRSLIARYADRTDLPGGLMLSCEPAPTDPAATLTGPVLAVVAQGRKRVATGERTYDYGAGQYLVVTVDLPVTGHFVEASPDEPFLGAGLVLKPEAVAALLLETATTTATSAAPSAITVSDAPDELLDAFVRLLRLTEHPADRRVLAPLIEKEILWRLVTGAQGATIRQIGLADSSLSHVGRAIRWIRDHHAESLRVADLARLAAMSESSFHRHFRAVTAMTPIQYQKHIRLQEARLLLLARTDDDVASIGYTVGYDSASQFSREYRRQFGIPPGQDSARLRAGMAN